MSFFSLLFVSPVYLNREWGRDGSLLPIELLNRKLVCVGEIPLFHPSFLERYVSLVEEKQELYQRELVQHGRTMEELSLLRDKEHKLEEDLQESRRALDNMKEEVTATQVQYVYLLVCDFMILAVTYQPENGMRHIVCRVV